MIRRTKTRRAAVMVCAAGMLASSASGRAATDSNAHEMDTVSLGTTVITATKKPEKQQNLSSTVNVLTEDELDMLQPRTSTDALHTVPGVFVHKTGAFGRADVTIRGTGDRGRRIMILMDGRPAKMGIFGCTVTHSIPATNVRRIEVVKGPGAVMYGSDAMGGVVNIMRKKPSDRLEINGFGVYGTYDTRHARARVGGAFDTWHYSVAGDYQQSDGHLDNTSYRAGDGSVQVGYSVNDNLSFTLNQHLFSGKKHEPGAAKFDTTAQTWYVPDSPADTGWNEYLRGAVSLDMDATIGGVAVNAQYSRTMGEHEFSDGWHSQDHTDGFTAHARALVLDMDSFENTLTTGVQLRNQVGTYVAGSVPFMAQDTTFSKYEGAVFLYDEQRILERLLLDAGLRYTHDESYGGHLSYRGGAVYRIHTALSVRASAATGFRAPQINELYLFPPKNPDLEPEESVNYEAGITFHPAGKLYLDIAGFYTEGTDMIEKAAVSGMPPFQFQNTGSFRRKGIETSLALQLAPHTRVKSGYTWIDPYSHAQGLVQNKYDLSMHYADSLFSALVGMQYLSNYYADNAQTQRIDMHGGIPLVYARSSWNIYKGISLFARVDNALGRNYAQFTDLPTSAGVYLMPGVDISAGIKYTY